jgi:hypothetical protein
MVYYKGKYHLFYQYFPRGREWGHVFHCFPAAWLPVGEFKHLEMASIVLTDVQVKTETVTYNQIQLGA